jgi:hypothetical protein
MPLDKATITEQIATLSSENTRTILTTLMNEIDRQRLAIALLEFRVSECEEECGIGPIEEPDTDYDGPEDTIDEPAEKDTP